MASALQSNERSVRSVFVGNIPYDATEEKLKDIFNEVGPVVSFRLVYDRETGKPKGYGFCEYRDQETAMSAMRNLNGYDLNNRILRVDNAANEKTKEEIRNLQTSINGLFESPYGPEVNPETAPEEISKAVASLPPEQMFELAKQMKQCVSNNPTEAKNMLIQNPQLCYGLLQALVVMRVVDPNVAMKMLYRNNPPVKPLKPQEPTPILPSTIPSLNTPQIPIPQNVPSWTSQTDQFGRQIPQPTAVLQPAAVVPSPSITSATPSSVINTASSQSSFDPRMYNRMRDIPSNNLDPRVRQQPQTVQPTTNLDPRFSQQNNSVSRVNNNNRLNTTQQFPCQNPVPQNILNQDQEKANLIMQVLQLSDSQIAILPPDQRQSIMLLKQQIQTTSVNNTT